jgi:hypothetical protein
LLNPLSQHDRPRDGGGRGGHQGRGGHRGGGGGELDRAGGAATGYFKQSFLEDPWLPLLRPDEVAHHQPQQQQEQQQQRGQRPLQASEEGGGGSSSLAQAVAAQPPAVEAAVKDEAEIDIDDL